MSFIYDNDALPADKVADVQPYTNPTVQWGRADANAIFQALRDIQTYLRTNTLDVAPATIPTANMTTANAQDLNLVIDTNPAVGPEMDYGGNRGRWFIGIDVANSPTSRDFVLTGQRGTYSFSDGVTTIGSQTVTSASGGGFTTDIIGAGISGAGIPVGATVTAVGGATSLTMSANATASAASVTITITRSSVQDLLYWKHRGALSATLGIGVTPPDGSARVQISPTDSEPTMGGMRIRRGPSQTGDVFAIHDSTPINRVTVDKDFYLKGDNPTTNGGIAIAADAVNQHAIVLTDSTKTNFYAFDLPAASGGVLRMRCQSGGNTIADFGTDGSIRHLSTKFGAYSATPVVKPTVTGSRGGNAALASLITALATIGWVTDST